MAKRITRTQKEQVAQSYQLINVFLYTITLLSILAILLYPLEYGFYQFFRWCVFGTAISVLYHHKVYRDVGTYQAETQTIVGLSIPVLLLFNPLFPVSLLARVWMWADILLVIYSVWAIRVFSSERTALVSNTKKPRA